MCRAFLVCIAWFFILTWGDFARAQFAPSINLSPPAPILLDTPRFSLWWRIAFPREPGFDPDGDNADLTPETGLTRLFDLRKFGFVVYRPSMGPTPDGMIDLSPRRRRWYARLYDDWPEGVLLPKPKVKVRPDGTIDLTPAQPTWMYAGGFDIWHTGAFAHGALLWSPYGLYSEGFTIKALAGGGTYRYISGALGGEEVRARQSLSAFMPGWRFKGDRFEVTAYAGLDIQEHSLDRSDPGNKLQGLHYGVRAGADFWFQFRKTEMLAANLSFSTIGPSYSVRVAHGWWMFNTAWLGTEAQAFSGPTYTQVRIGLHATAFVFAGLEWSAGAGYVVDDDRRDGVYARLGILKRR